LKRRKRKKEPRRFDFNFILTVVSIVIAIIATLLAIQANRLSERSLLITKAQYEEASIPQYVLDTNFVFTTSDSKFVTEELWCELIAPTNNSSFRPFIQLLVDSGMNNNWFDTISTSKKDLLLYAFTENFSEQAYANCFVDPTQELASIKKTPDWSFSDWSEIRLHALIRAQTVYYHVVQDYEAHLEFHISNGKLVNINFLKWQFDDDITFSRLEKFQDATPLFDDLIKRRDAMRDNTNLLAHPFGASTR
jgi:hypothetical protein